MAKPVDLGVIRKRIDVVDEAILELVARRLALARDAGVAKRRLGLDVVDPAREAEVRDRWEEHGAALGLPADLVVHLREALVTAARTAQVSDAARAPDAGIG